MNDDYDALAKNSADDRSFAAAQAFLLAVKSHWTTQQFPAIRAEYQSRVDASAAKPATVLDVEHLMATSTRYQFFAWFERHLQRMKYAGRYGLQHWVARDRLTHEAMLAATASVPASRLELDPAMPLPRYYTAVDIHQHPGGVWSDPLAGLVYERGARSTTPLAAARHRDLHDRFAEQLIGAGAIERVLDMGCGFGKSTRPIAAALPGATIDAIDLAAPCLALAAHDAQQAGLTNVRYRQMSAAATDYAPASFDLVTSTMLLHELPPPEIKRVLAEAARVLKPGGRMVHLDFLPQAQPRGRGDDALFARFIHYGHGRRNNEPFMAPLAELDLVAMLESIGFTNVRIDPFAEADGTLAPDYPAWRFPWTVIAAERRAG